MNLKEAIKKPIVLAGVMGSGKSTVGRKLAKKLDLKFYDSDKVVEEQQGCSIVDIYEFRGAEYFHEQEAAVIKQVLEYGPLVLSTGGSSSTNQELREFIKSKALVIWLEADIQILHERVSRRNTRPELNSGDKIEILQRMIDESRDMEAHADIVVESLQQEPHYIIDIIVSKLKQYYNIVL